jgi:hypothetical protein
MGLITLDVKSTGKLLAGNPHEQFDVAGAGDGSAVLDTAPVPDPTTFPPPDGYWGTHILFRVCKKNNGMKQQSNGVPENLLLETVAKTVGFIRTGTRASSLCARSTSSN